MTSRPSKQLSPRQCYCDSNLLFKLCCKPYLKEEKSIPTVEVLVRARYSAYCVKAIQFLKKTWAKETLPSDLYTPKNKKDFPSHWKKLEIIDWKQEERSGWVAFKAYYAPSKATKDPVKAVNFLYEKSRFRKENGKWLYVSGEHLNVD